MLTLTDPLCIPFIKEDPVSTQAIKATSYIVMMLVSLLGNAAVITIIAKNRHMRTTTNSLIARTITQIFVGYQGWLIDGLSGAILFKVVYFFQEISTAFSIQSIVVITLDRYIGVVEPFRKPFITPKRLKFVIALIWLISMGLHGIYFYIARLKMLNGISIRFFSFEPAFDTWNGNCCIQQEVY